jgi:starch synthase
VSLLEATLPGTRTPVWLVDCPPAYDRPGNPYLDPTGHEWGDNAQRYALLARVACRIVAGVPELGWRPDIVHGHDWQAGLVPALLAQRPERPATVFTIHNLAYQGLFPYATFTALQLPVSLWSMDGLEFHEQLSFMKGGLTFADRITTVSPTYAREIQTPAFGCGLEGLLRHRAAYLRGILNGIDIDEWNPQDDRHLVMGYSAERLEDKRANKLALQEQVGLPPAGDTPLLGLVGRLVQQKGVDLILEALPRVLAWPLQVVTSATTSTSRTASRPVPTCS